MALMSGFVSESNPAFLSAIKGWPTLLAEGGDLTCHAAREGAGVANRILDVWVDVLFCGEQLAVAALQAGSGTAAAMREGLLQAVAAAPLQREGIHMAAFCWSVVEAACLPYRDAAGRIAHRLSVDGVATPSSEQFSRFS